MKVLVARCDRLGDLVLSLPALAWLRRARPDWELHALVAPGAEAVIEHDPALDGYYTWDATSTTAVKPRLARERYDAAVLLQYQTPLAQLLRDAGIGRRHGPLSKLSSWFLLNRGRWQRRSRTERHERDLNIALVKHLAGRDATDGPVADPMIHLGPEQQVAGERFRANEAGGAEVVVFVHPGSGGSALDWPAERFAAVANALSQRPGWRVFITGSHHDRLTIQALSPHLDSNVSLLSERYPLREFLGVVATGDVMIAPSTGPLHLAAALGLAAVGLYPPAPTMSPRRWGPLGPWSEAMVPVVDCPARRHCQLEQCLLYNCLDAVLPSQVVDTAERLVELRRCQRTDPTVTAAPTTEGSP